MWSWFTFFLLVHIIMAISAFGPTYAFPVIAKFAKRDPRNAHLATEVIHTIHMRVTIPAAVAMPFIGLALIYLGHFNLWKSEWLLISIVLYITAFFTSVLFLRPNEIRMLRLIEQMPAPPAPGTAPIAGGSGPPPEIAAVGRNLDLGGMLVTLLLTAIIVLMVWRPGSCQGIC
jgi:uncharacterized membrane protein